MEMKYKFIFGLFGCSHNGVLYTPSSKKIIKLPNKLAFKIHTFLNKYISYSGLEGTKLIFSKIGE